MQIIDVGIREVWCYFDSENLSISAQQNAQDQGNQLGVTGTAAWQTASGHHRYSAQKIHLHSSTGSIPTFG